MRLKINLAAAVAAATLAAACNDTEPALEIPTDTPDSAVRDQRGDEAPASVRVNGCLQAVNGDYVLTTASPAANPDRPGEPQGTQVETARASYRLNGDDDSFKKMLGGRVQVTGTMGERPDLPSLERAARADRSTDRSAERGNEAPPLDLDVSQLAELRVTSITPTGEACGTGSARRNGN